MAAGKTKQNDVERERERLAALFTNADETRRELLDGMILESARCRCEIDRLVAKREDLIKRNAPFAVTVQIDNLIVKLRASYTNINEKLAKWLTGGNDDDWTDGLEDYV